MINRVFVRGNEDPMSEDLAEIQKDLQIILDRNDISRFIDPKTISEWLIQEDKGFPRFILTANMISGLLSNEFFDGPDKTEELLGVMKRISDCVNREKLERANRDGGPEAIYLMNNAIPPIEWMDVYEEAFHMANENRFHEASQLYDKTFLSLLKDETTDREPYRIFFNASNGYLFGGRPDLGMACLKYSLELNPNYPLARERIKALRSGDLDLLINLGSGSRMLSGLGVEYHGTSILDVNSIPPWNLKVGLRSVGIRVTKEDIITWSKKYHSIRELIDRDLEVKDGDRDLVVRSISGLWSIYCPDEPYHELLEDIILDLDEYIKNQIYYEELEEDISELEWIIFTGRKNFLAGFPPFKEIGSSFTKAMMNILMLMGSKKKLRKRGLKIAKELERETANPIWSVPVKFLKEKNIRRLKRIVEEYRKDDHELVIIRELAEKFLDNRMDHSETGIDGNEENLSIFDDPPDGEQFMKELIGGNIMERFEEIAKDDSWKEKMNPDLLFHPASIYYRYLKGLGLNFATEGDVESSTTPLMSNSRKEKKIGRNKPCPCGSGKKYKKCCMIK